MSLATPAVLLLARISRTFPPTAPAARFLRVPRLKPRGGRFCQGPVPDIWRLRLPSVL